MIFDTLAYSRRLKAAGFSDAQAEVLAEANREMIADEMVTKSFLQSELSAAIAQLRAELRAEMKELEMGLTLRMGAIAVAVVAALTAIIKL
jgi:hypothetical protein